MRKNSDTVHNFSKDPLKLFIDGDNVKAKGTTLGADNGIAVAMAMAILDSSDIPHPPIEAVFTTDEEVGLLGAMSLDTSTLKGKYLINIDSEEEGIFCTSCAGGARVDAFIPISKISLSGYSTYKIFIRGLKGGHSGMDINKGLGNSIKLLGRILYNLTSEFDFYIYELTGGSKDNAIPRESEAIVLLKDEDFDDISDYISAFEKTLQKEFRGVDDKLELKIENFATPLTEAFTKQTAKKVIACICAIPNGVEAMSLDIDGLVETSNNLGVLETFEKEIVMSSATRSSVTSRKLMLINRITSLVEALGGKTGVRGDYPGWEYNSDSKLRPLFMKVYEEMFKKEATINAIHAGLECGIFFDKIEGLDIISLGPDVVGAHTPEEALSISSTERVYDLILKALAETKNYL